MRALTIAHVDGPPLGRLDEVPWLGDVAGIGSSLCPERPAIVFPDRDRQVSYCDLQRRSEAFAELMRSRGIGAGSRVAYLGRNSDLFVPALFGNILAGTVLVPLNWRLTARELAFQLVDSKSKLLISDPEFAELAARACRDDQVSPDDVIALMLTEAADPSQAAWSHIVEPVAGTLQEALLAAAPTRAAPRDPGQPILQLYTSGTTGKPKGVLISHRAVSVTRHAELISPELQHLRAGTVFLSAMPNSHIGGISWLLMGLVRQCTVVLTADPSPANLLRLMREYGAQYTFIVPTVLRALVDEVRCSGVTGPRLRGVCYGAMPMSERLLREALEVFDCDFVQFFGMTEIAGSATMLGPRDHDVDRPALLKSVGKPYPGMQLEIRGPDGAVLRPGEHGEIWVNSPTIMLGYSGLPEKTREVVIDGWYRTGDGGYVDAAGHLYLTDRIKDMIVTGGENVYPAEVEEVLRQHPAVLDAAVVGIPDDHWGEKVVALVQTRPAAKVTESELQAFARERIAGYKCPKSIRLGDSLPRTAAGKVKRVEVRSLMQRPDCGA